MRFVITGATGHIGNNVVRALRKQYPDAQIVTLGRRPATRELADVACEQIVGDLFDDCFLRTHIHAGDYVVHAAGYIDLSGKHTAETYRVNYDLTKVLADLCRAVGVAQFIYFGSVDGIAKDGDATPISEPSFFDATPICGDYGKSKAMAMEYVRSLMEQDPAFPAVMLLPSAVLGVHDYRPSPIGNVLRGILRGKAEFGIKGGYNFVDVIDVAEAVVSACERNARGVYILAGENISVGQLYLLANQTLGIKRSPILLPTFVAWLAMPFVPVLNPVTLRALREAHNYDSSAAKRDLGYAPRSFTETLAATLTWFQGQEKQKRTDA